MNLTYPPEYEYNVGTAHDVYWLNERRLHPTDALDEQDAREEAV